jgi:hypothetical protein
MTRPKQTKIQRDAEICVDLSFDGPWTKRFLRRLVREAVNEIWHADGTRTIRQLREHLAKKLVP